MSDHISEGCRPPKELADRDGWHWVGLFGHTKAAPEQWDSANKMWLGGIPREPDCAHDAGYRYRAPVASPASVRGLVEALEAIANAKPWVGSEAEFGSGHDTAREGAADIAREALARAKEAGV